VYCCYLCLHIAGTYGAFATRKYEQGDIIMAYCGYMHTEQGFLVARSAVLDRLKREGYTSKLEREQAKKCGMYSHVINR
jgi:hypothetical protein